MSTAVQCQDIMSSVLSTVGDIILCRLSTVGGYYEYCGYVQYRGSTQITKDLSLHGTENP